MQRILENLAAASHHWRKKCCTRVSRLTVSTKGREIGSEVVRPLTEYNAVCNDAAGYPRYPAHFLRLFATRNFTETRRFLRGEIFCARRAYYGFKYSCLSATPICISDNKACITRRAYYITPFLLLRETKFYFIASGAKIVLKRLHITSNFREMWNNISQ